MKSIKDRNHYTLFAEIFDFPELDYITKVNAIQLDLNKNYPEAAEWLEPFTANILLMKTIHHEELFIRSFDVQAVTTLDVGYVMFGDDYKRGQLLVNLNREHREVQNDCGTELSDNLANVLRLLPKMAHSSIRSELVQRIIAPALVKMIHTFDPKQMEIQDKFYRGKHKTIIDRPIADYLIYRRALKALLVVLVKDFGAYEENEEQKTSDFLRNIATEVKLEG
jgi:nitrate reductase assembly molybdenum cofactor insertion protein NarJ